MNRKIVGLVLSGGGARGFAHVGVVKVLAENNIPIDLVTGTSAGSFVGGALACGLSANEILEMASKIRWPSMVRPAFSFKGLLSNAPMGRFLEQNLPVQRIEDLKIPFAAVAYDLNKSETVIFKDTGDLRLAIRSSCTVPGVFVPLHDGNGRQLVDGGIVSSMPTEVARSMGADVVIAVDLVSCGATFKAGRRSGFGIAIRSAMTLLRTATQSQRSLADIVIDPSIAHLRPDQISRRDEFIRLGEEAALARIKEIKSLISVLS